MTRRPYITFSNAGFGLSRRSANKVPEGRSQNPGVRISAARVATGLTAGGIEATIELSRSYDQ